jgi:diguanylate cyclase (GGDEF)-like protein/PAS domain S-box-containing protein
MHKLLQRQLKCLDINSEGTNLDNERFNKLIDLISERYKEDDATISFMQNRKEVSSEEMQVQYANQKEENQLHLNAIIAGMPDLMFLVDAEGNYLEVYADNKEHLLASSKEDLLKTSIPKVFDKTISDQLLDLIQNTIKTNSLHSMEFELNLPKDTHYFEVRAISTGLKKNSQDTVVIISRDITERKKQEATSRLIETVFNEATEGIIIENKDRIVIHANNAIERILGIPIPNLLGKHSDYLSSMIPVEIQDEIFQAMTTKGVWQGEVEISPPNAKKIYSWLTLDAIMDHNNVLSNIVLMITDISEIHHSRRQMEYLASYDTLTDLPNRSLLFKQLKISIASMQRRKTNGMLLFIDIDHFKEFNDSYGHQIGDKVLLAVAKKITSICRKEDILGRLSGDEFLLISEDLKDEHAAATIIDKIQNIFKKPQKIDNLSLHISVSMGIALYPKNGKTPEALINAADQAMYSVKKQGRNDYAFYSQEMSDIAHEHFFILRALKDAINAKNFILAYQPQFSLQDSKLIGIEVLLRCTHSRIKNIPVSRLISIAEETGLISKISHLVLDMACEQIYQWKLLKLKLPQIAINLSRKELSEEHLVITIHDALARFKINPREIELEITESALLHENMIVKENILRLQKLGHSFSIDDYGTGFSSLANIKTFHFDKLKIDKIFIDNIITNTDDQVIVSATISMAQKLGLKVIAEGVEIQAQADILKDFGCDIVQGYLYSEPLMKEDMENLLQS